MFRFDFRHTSWPDKSRAQNFHTPSLYVIHNCTSLYIPNSSTQFLITYSSESFIPSKYHHLYYTLLRLCLDTNQWLFNIHAQNVTRKWKKIKKQSSAMSVATGLTQSATSSKTKHTSNSWTVMKTGAANLVSTAIKSLAESQMKTWNYSSKVRISILSTMTLNH